jgi:hypothetical protein
MTCTGHPTGAYLHQVLSPANLSTAISGPVITIVRRRDIRLLSRRGRGKESRTGAVARHSGMIGPPQPPNVVVEPTRNLGNPARALAAGPLSTGIRVLAASPATIFFRV